MRTKLSILFTLALFFSSLSMPVVAASDSSLDPKNLVLNTSRTAHFGPGSHQETHLTLKFDAVPSRDEIQEVEKLLSEPQAPMVDVASSSSSDGFANLNCNLSYGWLDSNGYYSLQHSCRSSTAPWGYRLSGPVQKIISGTVSESGMKWTRNGVNMGKQSPHLSRPKNYQFHGTYNPVKKNDKISYTDSFTFRHNVDSGGTGVVKINGKWRFTNG